MKLNPTCVRDILLFVESEATFNNNVIYTYDNIPEQLCKYSHEEIIYHFLQCHKSGLIEVGNYADNGEYFRIADLEPKGHEFLTNIRSDTVWKQTLAVGSKIGSTSLDVLVKISTGVITELIKQQLQLPPR